MVTSACTRLVAASAAAATRVREVVILRECLQEWFAVEKRWFLSARGHAQGTIEADDFSVQMPIGHEVRRQGGELTRVTETLGKGNRGGQAGCTSCGSSLRSGVAKMPGARVQTRMPCWPDPAPAAGSCPQCRPWTPSRPPGRPGRQGGHRGGAPWCRARRLPAAPAWRCARPLRRMTL